MPKAILHRGAKWHAKLKSDADKGARHGKRAAGALATRSARQMADFMRKAARAIVEYAKNAGLARVVVGRNVDGKQGVALGAKQNQLFTFMPHGKLIEAIRAKCIRAGIEFTETEESYTSKTDHLALEPMAPKAEGASWLGSRSTRGCFRSSMGVTLHADVNGCLGIGRKVGGEEWLRVFLQKLGSSPGTRLVPRKLHLNGMVPALSPGFGMAHPRAHSRRRWISTKVALAKAGLSADLQVVPKDSSPLRAPQAA